MSVFLGGLFYVIIITQIDSKRLKLKTLVVYQDTNKNARKQALDIMRDICDYFSLPYVTISKDVAYCNRRGCEGIIIEEHSLIKLTSYNIWLVVHEVTHYVQDKLYNGSDLHGYTWRKAKSRVNTFLKNTYNPVKFAYTETPVYVIGSQEKTPHLWYCRQKD